tara:strand:- start:1277 stop:1762 length:486 start_codon:yes stop_codon:yes gene_type:complete
MANRAIDLIITYRVIKLLSTPFNRQEAYKYGIIDDKGKVLKKFKTLQKPEEKKAYTLLHRFVFNLKRILQKIGLGSRLGSFAVALGLLIKENKEYVEHQSLIESAVVTYLKDTQQFIDLLKEEGDVPDYIINEEPAYTCFGIDVYEKDGQLYSEKEYAKTL